MLCERLWGVPPKHRREGDYGSDCQEDQNDENAEDCLKGADSHFLALRVIQWDFLLTLRLIADGGGALWACGKVAAPVWGRQNLPSRLFHMSTGLPSIRAP